MTTLKNHPGYWLRADAAAAFDRAEADHGVFVVNSAGRTEADQQALINRWNKGGAGNRPPALFRPAMPASASNHVKNGGTAVDLRDYMRFAAVCEAYGFRHTYPSGDVVHFDFVGGGSSPASVASDQDVVNRQNYLNATFSAGLAVDGKNGPKTAAAIAAYQVVLGVASDGVWGPNTQSAHQAYYDAHHPASAGNLSRGSKGAEVSRLQSTLNAKYPLYSKLATDGDFGPGTEKTVREFQRRAGLVVDGIAGYNTLHALGLA